MSINTFRLEIRKPCHESWEKMTEVDIGRHCAQCQKVVVDFTGLPDGEISRYMTSHTNVCGRFEEHQLAKIYSSVKPPIPRYNHFILWAKYAAFLAFGFSGKKLLAGGVMISDSGLHSLKWNFDTSARIADDSFSFPNELWLKITAEKNAPWDKLELLKIKLVAGKFVLKSSFNANNGLRLSIPNQESFHAKEAFIEVQNSDGKVAVIKLIKLIPDAINQLFSLSVVLHADGKISAEQEYVFAGWRKTEALETTVRPMMTRIDEPVTTITTVISGMIGCIETEPEPSNIIWHPNYANIPVSKTVLHRPPRLHTEFPEAKREARIRNILFWMITIVTLGISAFVVSRRKSKSI